MCDPAIGSGAFPMAMVYEILRIKKELRPYSVQSHSFSFNYRNEKLNIIKNSIYGVDIDNGAVDIARLRFWLSLIVDEEEPSPLPNLDYKIMQGDSLKEYFEDIPLDNLLREKVTVYLPHQQLALGQIFSGPQKEIEFTTEEKIQLKELADKYFDVTNYNEKNEVHLDINKRIIQHIEKNIELVKLHLERQIGELKSNLKIPNDGLKIKDAIKYYKSNKKFHIYLKQKGKLVKAEKELKRKRAKLLNLEQNPEKPYFLWHLFFGDVITNREGFDIVIGNPPYGVRVDDRVRDIYNIESKDSYGAFMALALQKLLKPDGILSYIVSDTWLTISSHYKIREQFLNRTICKIIRLHQDCFKATVNSCIFTLINTLFSREVSKKVIAADLTNISTRKFVSEFREKIFNLEAHINEITPTYAVYTYPQSLLLINSNKPIIVGSPTLFELMNDTSCKKSLRIIEEDIDSSEVEVKNINSNGRIIDLIKVGDIAEVKVGLQTGDNDHYLYQNSEARGNYKDINTYKKFLLTKEDLLSIRNDEDLRLEVIDKGIHRTNSEPNYNPKRYFDGRYIVPYDKGGESDTEDGWLPNYYAPTNYYIEYHTNDAYHLNNCKLIRKESHKPYPRNITYYFKEGITYSPTGVYSPTFRIGSSSIFGHKGSTIFIFNSHRIHEVLGIASSKLFKYLLKNYLSHSVETREQAILEMIIPLSLPKEIEILVSTIIEKQKIDPHYEFLNKEQKEIDRLVYHLFNLNEEDINEVEAWFARRYPKLAKYTDIKEPVKSIAENQGTEEEKWLSIINQGENKKVEFKSTLRFCLRKATPQSYIEHSALKNIAAFLNTEGGYLLIGVEDDGNIIGLEKDFSTFRGHNKKDEFMKHFDILTQKYLGNHLTNNFEIVFPVIHGKTICAIKINGPAPEPVLLMNMEKGNKEEFYIRRQASSVTLTMFEFYNYAKEHWK